MSSRRTPRTGWPAPSQPLRSTLAVLVLCLLATLPAPSARAQDGHLSTFLDSVEVNLVNLEVFVTDRQGNRVDGLTRDDFTVEVDGTPVEITNFHVARPAPTGTADAPASTPAAPTDAPTAALAEAAPAPEAAAPQRPMFLTVFVDNLHTRPFNRKRLMEALEPVLAERLAAGDQVMLVAFDRSLKVLNPFTEDPEVIDSSLRRLQRMGTHRQVVDTELRTLVAALDRDGRQAQDPAEADSNALAATEVRVDSYQARREQEALGTFKALRSVILGMAGIPGRKALFYVSDGIPRFPGEELNLLLPGAETNQLPSRRRRRDLRPIYRDVVHQANAHEVTLYTFDARGSAPSFSISAEGNVLLGTNFDFTRNANFQEPLMQMAADTGGQVIMNTFNFTGVLEEVVGDFGNYYSIGFPAPTADGSYHDVDVRVKGRGLRVRHREGYLAKNPAARVADRTQSFLLQGWQSNPMGVELQFGEPKKTRRTWRVPVLIRVPGQAITLIPQDDEMVGRLQLFVAVRDDEGRVSEPTRLERDVRISATEMGQRAAGDDAGDLGYAVELEMRPGLQSLVVGVWDEVGGDESYVYQRVSVGEAKP